jgi:5-methylcytosine-specific restriction endonuclease McrA
VKRVPAVDTPGKELDHVVPVARGGRHALANILPACGDCNAHKSDLLLVQWKQRPSYPQGR